MSTQDEWGKEDRLQALAETLQKIEVIEREWKHWRAQSRTLSLELVTIDKLPVAEVSRLSGHHRNTLKVWLQIHNAEQGAKRGQADGRSS